MINKGWTLSYSSRDPHTLVELSAFSAINRFQPFNVAVSSNVLLLMVGEPQPWPKGDRRRITMTSHWLFFFFYSHQDFHCHLTTSEVVGYLGGRWDTNTQREWSVLLRTRKKRKKEWFCSTLLCVFSADSVEGLPLPDQTGWQRRCLCCGGGGNEHWVICLI